MRKFFSVWLILLVIIAFVAALLISYPVLTSAAQQTASDDLNVLLDAAFTRIALAKDSAQAVIDASDSNVLSKARAVDRFLAHDDGLLATDALLSLCDLLNVSSVDVTDMDGSIVASSTEARIGRSLVDDSATAWTKEVLDGENLSRTLSDKDNPALLAGCVSRTDTEGLVYIQSLDVAILEAMTAASPEQVLLDMSFVKDTLAVTDADGAFDMDESGYIVTRTQDGVTLSAMRPLSQVYAERSAVLFVEAVGFLLCMLFAAVIQSMLIKKRLEGRGAPASAPGEDALLLPDDATPLLPEGEADENAQVLPEPEPETEPEPAAPASAAEPGEAAAQSERDDAAVEAAFAEAAPAGTRARRARRERKPRKKIFEFVDIVEEAETPDDGETAQTELPAAPQAAEEAAIAAEAAVEFAAPQAVIEEPAAQEASRAHKKDRAPAGAAPGRKPRRGRTKEAPPDADGAFDKIFD